MDYSGVITQPSHRRPWTDEEDHLLRTLIADGELIAPIAMALGRTREAVRNRANLHGLPVRSSPGRGRRRMEARERPPAAPA